LDAGEPASAEPDTMRDATPAATRAKMRFRTVLSLSPVCGPRDDSPNAV
jgi:hypothetical protein